MWIRFLLEIIEAPLPPECLEVSIDDRGETIWWKCKKWALKIINRAYERLVLYSTIITELILDMPPKDQSIKFMPHMQITILVIWLNLQSIRF